MLADRSDVRVDSHHFLQSAVIFLLATVIAVPLTKRFRLGSVLGYLLAGVVIGPQLLGLIGDTEGVATISEFGVVLMLFVIGLELSPQRLWVMRRSVFGTGLLQVASCGIAIAAVAYYLFGLSGKGAELSGGRWNRKGTPVVYASTSRALACLETVVHLTQTPLPLNRYLVEIVVPQVSWNAAAGFDAAQAIGWDAEPAGKVSLDWGTAWAKGASTLLARVPSVAVEEEFNVLINPMHPDLSVVRARKVRRWLYDGRFAA